ncbi:MAG: peptide/nickel transport system permease protein [Thermomicrobiales bacterium]|nr:peptide/nickel transport system permease protein [Thermomicrobiales bacterium]MEA2584591.1 peptide/nickel transport system permease protein [Thermomicrobiales bacterium]MEA2597198.1 peptide/nickel transport system permease protein [Thermomicrobiales bacterium]
MPVLLVSSTLVFFIFQVIPGDEATARLGMNSDPQAAENLRRQLGLDRPLFVQYLDWLGKAVRGDLGKSYVNEQSVTSLVLEKFPATLQIAFMGVLLSLLISVPVGTIAALRRGTWIDQVARMIAMVGYCVPRYWLGVLLILAFAVRIQWLPPAGYVPFTEDPVMNLRYAALPVIALAATLAAVQMRFLRSSLLDVVAQDYVRTAYAKGLTHRVVVVRHALSNALIPFITVVGLQFAELLGGLVVVEQIFAWPGVGWLMVQSITQRDVAVVQGAVLLVAVGFVLINLLVDIAYAYLDPRIHESYVTRS